MMYAFTLSTLLKLCNYIFRTAEIKYLNNIKLPLKEDCCAACVCAAHLIDSGVLPFRYARFRRSANGVGRADVQRYKIVGTVRVSVCRAFADRRSSCVCIIANKAVCSTCFIL